ncbi:MAG: metallophosphoesterase [Deltaproteobacteria bacterium]|nr:metallophosphoesterase [Deltaproteobacteria bacterium]
MKVFFISDLHFDHNPGLLNVFVDFLKKHKPEVLVVGGDLFNGSSRLGGLLKILKEHTSRLLFVPGNHDLWHSDTLGAVDTTEMYRKYIRGTVLRSGCDYLPSGGVIINGIGFAGTTGWYDAFPASGQKTPDEKLCFFPGLASPSDVVEKMAEDLERQLYDLETHVDRIAVTVHTVPFPAKIADSIEENILGYQGSDVLGNVIMKHDKVKHVFSGHLHRQFRARIGDKVWQSVAYGYARELSVSPEEHLLQCTAMIDF